MVWEVSFHDAFEPEFEGFPEKMEWRMVMAKKLVDVLASLPKARRERIEARAMELVTLKDLRQAVQQTQEQLAATLGVGQDTISRLEKRTDMLLSTMRHYIESMGGQLELVARFPNRPPVVIDQLGGGELNTHKQPKLPRGSRSAIRV